MSARLRYWLALAVSIVAGAGFTVMLSPYSHDYVVGRYLLYSVLVGGMVLFSPGALRFFTAGILLFPGVTSLARRLGANEIVQDACGVGVLVIGMCLFGLYNKNKST